MTSPAGLVIVVVGTGADPVAAWPLANGRQGDRPADDLRVWWTLPRSTD
jgi:hypothetical protein